VVGKNYRLQDIQLLKNFVEATSCELSASSQRRPLARQLLSKLFGFSQERFRSTNRLQSYDPRSTLIKQVRLFRSATNQPVAALSGEAGPSGPSRAQMPEAFAS
jgi:hypothetical protein